MRELRGAGFPSGDDLVEQPNEDGIAILFVEKACGPAITEEELLEGVEKSVLEGGGHGLCGFCRGEIGVLQQA